MKRFLLLALLVVGGYSLTGCSKVPAGSVGVKVYLLGQTKGVSTEVLTPGRYWIGINQELHLFPTFQQNYSWTANMKEGSASDESFTIQTSEGQSVNCDIAVTYHYEEDKISGLFQKFREGNEEIRDKQLHNYVRNAMNEEASKMLVSEIYGPKKIAFITAVEKAVRAKVASDGIIVDQLSLIGAFRLPESLEKALNSKNEAVQKAQQVQNEVLESRAQAEKNVAIAEGEAKSILVKARAQAQANRELASSITAALIEDKKVNKWDGVLPLIIGGGNSNQTMMIDTSKLAAHRKAVAAPVAEEKTEE